MPIATIVSRKGRGWTDEKTLTEPVFSNDTKITKNDLELYLNEISPALAPLADKILKLCPANIKKKGQYARRFFPKEFDRYFNEVYKPRKQDELRLQKDGNIS